MRRGLVALRRAVHRATREKTNYVITITPGPNAMSGEEIGKKIVEQLRAGRPRWDHLHDPAFWEKVADVIAKHHVTGDGTNLIYDLSDPSHRVYITQIVLQALRWTRP